jgi:hypothetical protein
MVDKTLTLGYIKGMDKRKKLGRFIMLLPLVLLFVPILLSFLPISPLFYIENWFGRVLLLIQEYRLTLVFVSFIIAPLYFTVGIYLMIRYRDNKDPILKIVKDWFNFKERIKKSQRYTSPKSVLKNILILVIVILPIFLLTIFFHSRFSDPSRFDPFDRYPYNIPNSQVRLEEVGVEKIKENLLSLIPEGYELIEKDYEPLNAEDDGCVYLYEIYPKEYSEMEEKYLNNASLIYCGDIHTAILRDQTEDVRYNKTEGKFLYGVMERPLEEELFGDNLVSIVELGGSHRSSNYYILRIENSNELVILAIPTWNRIRCDFVEGGDEKHKCEEYLSSMWEGIDYSDSVPENYYNQYFNDLLKTLSEV